MDKTEHDSCDIPAYNIRQQWALEIYGTKLDNKSISNWLYPYA